MLKMTIREQGCRGCGMCLEVCPTDCLSFDEHNQKAVVAKIENCIACLSCAFICPSQAIGHADIHLVKNFYRNIHFSQRMEKFL